MAYTVVMFPKIQVDTAIAYFLLTTFGEGSFPGVSNAPIEFWTAMPDGRTAEQLESEGYILVDMGDGKFDHHVLGQDNRKITSSLLIARHLGADSRADIQKLLELARRDDLEGKGTLSADPIDRAFGISALLTNLNKSMPNDSRAVLDAMLPLITAHFLEENRRHVQLPLEYKELEAQGKVMAAEAIQLGRRLKIVMVESDNASLAGYLRSKGMGAALVIQKSSTGHVNFISNQSANVRLHKLARVVKSAEARKSGIDIAHLGHPALERAGRTEPIPHWYYDTRANTLQNGGLNPQGIPATQLKTEEIITLVIEGLRIDPPAAQRPPQARPMPPQARQPQPRPSEQKPAQGKPSRLSKGHGVVYLD